jgi:propanol-preferring alcohol dehydrogenase
MSELPAFPYDLLRGERSVRSVANLTRADGEEFMALASQVPVHTEVETFPLTAANKALARLRSGAVNGAVALSIAPTAPAERLVRPSSTAVR